MALYCETDSRGVRQGDGMKILYVDQTGKLGGGELAILPWLREQRDGACVVLFEDGPFRELIEECGIPVHVLSYGSLKNLRRESGLISVLRALPTFLSFRRDLSKMASGYDLLYANSQKAFFTAALAKRRGQPLIWHLRDILTADHFSTVLRRIAIFFANRFASLVVVNSYATADSFIAAGGLKSKVRVVHDGVSSLPFDHVDPGTVSALRKEFQHGTEPLIGIFGRLSPWKGQHILLDALSSIPNAQVVIVGDALFGEESYAASLKARAEKTDIHGRVNFLGFRRDIPALMKSMDIIVHASTSPEPFGLVIVEGMLSGKPVIATRAGGAAEIIEDKKSGLLVSPGSVPEMRSALLSLIANADDVKRLAETGRSRALESFSLELMFSGLSKAIRELTSEVSGGQ